MVKWYIYSITLYGIETCTMKKIWINKLEALWSLRRMMHIPCGNMILNDVLRGTSVERKLFKRRKITYLGHMLRGANYKTPQLILQGKIGVKTGVCRKQRSWLRNFKQWNIHHWRVMSHWQE